MCKYINIFRRGSDGSQSKIRPYQLSRSMFVQKAMSEERQRVLISSPLSPRLTRRRFGFVSEGQFQAVGNSSRRDVVPSESTLTG